MEVIGRLRIRPGPFGEEQLRDHLGEVVRGTFEETLNALLEANADALCGT